MEVGGHWIWSSATDLMEERDCLIFNRDSIRHLKEWINLLGCCLVNNDLMLA